MGLLKTLRREEILEVLSEGFCRQCHPLLEDRIRRIHNSKKAVFYFPSFIIIIIFFPLFDSFSSSFSLFLEQRFSRFFLFTVVCLPIIVVFLELGLVCFLNSKS